VSSPIRNLGGYNFGSTTPDMQLGESSKGLEVLQILWFINIKPQFRPSQ
jgi:hypothetical protein